MAEVMSDQYDRRFFDTVGDWAAPTARVLLPQVIEAVEPRSVVDLGCGEGAWLAVFRELGVDDLVGVDGGHVDPAALRIDRDRFVALDLATERVTLPRSFDLAISLETAEHLPAERARSFVEDLTKLAPVVLFSAAIPFQGGVGHINEQWPDYWLDLFADNDFELADRIGLSVWDEKGLPSFYAQNTMLLARSDHLAGHPELRVERVAPGRLIHPHQYLVHADPPPPPPPPPPTLRALVRELPRAASDAARWTLKRRRRR